MTGPSDQGPPVPRRWPRRVFRAGDEPDARFTFANERTFLAWIRTSLAILAAGVALDALEVPAEVGLRTFLSVLLTATAVVLPIGAFARWIGSERALRHQQPLPAPLLVPAVTAVLVVAAVAVLVASAAR